MHFSAFRGQPFFAAGKSLAPLPKAKKSGPVNRGRFQYDNPGLISNQDSDRSWRSAEFQTAEPATGSGSWNKPGQVLSG